MNFLLRNTQGELIAMKKEILDQCISKKMKCKDGSKLLKMHLKAFSKLKRRYIEKGEDALIPKKPGPKNGRAPNKTPQDIEDLVVNIARGNRNLGPVPLSDIMADVYTIKIDSVTVWRILKRTGWRYTANYVKIEKEKPKFYCLDEPGEEIQLDGSYPFGRSRKIICFDAIDDCSRRAYSRVYSGTENTEIAIDFVERLILDMPFRINKIRIDNKLSKRFDEYCKKRGIEVIRNDPYKPTQNGKVERYHKTIKHKVFWAHFGYNDNLEILQYKLKLWLKYYNNNRRHGGYGMNRMTPNGKIASILVKKYYNSYMSSNYPQKVALTMQQYNY